MIAKIFGTLDLTSVLLIVLMHFGIFLTWKILLFHVAFLILKGVIFWSDFNSWMDMAIGCYMVLMGLGVSCWLDWVAIIYLFQKGIVSMQ